MKGGQGKNMVEVRNDGGPAFGAYVKAGELTIFDPGMSLRDYFAAKAIHALLTAPTGQIGIDGKIPNMSTHSERDFAKAAYVIADAMLEERK